MPLTFLIGGARSGKSALAVELGRRHGGPVVYVATAPAVDDDMARRIRHHRDERPADWETIEEQVALADAIGRATGAMVIVDCLTLWVSNLLAAGHDDTTVLDLAGDAARLARERHPPIVAISNEVGLGVHPTTELGRRYRDVLGGVNQRWASAADTALLLLAGRALPLHDPHDHLPEGPT